MNYHKWTLALAATGVVSLPSVLSAAPPVFTAVTGTTLSGYVDTSAQWNLGTGNNNNPPYFFGGGAKADGFNLNVADVAIYKWMDDSPWASGYHAEFWMGPDAATLGTLGSSDSFGSLGIRQAYVSLRTPIGNGIDWKLGQFDSIIGYENLTSYANPNYTHSYGFTIEPKTQTGLLGTYKFNDSISLSAGIANTVGPQVNGRAFPNKAESYKTYMGSVTLTAPQNWGWLAGGTMSAGVINGFGSKYDQNQTSWYYGVAMPTPVAGLKTGISLDYLDVHHWRQDHPTAANDGNAWSLAYYFDYQISEDFSLNLREEYLDDQAFYFDNPGDEGEAFKVWAFTATAQYNLWKNVTSRLEFRWDHSDSGQLFGFNQNTSSSTTSRKNAYLLALNFIYQF